MLLYFFLISHTFLLYHTIHMWSRFLWASAVYSYFVIHNKFGEPLTSLRHHFFYLTTESLPGLGNILHIFAERVWGFLPGLRARSYSLCLFSQNSSDEKCIHSTGSWKWRSCNLLTTTGLSLPFSPSLLAPGLKYLSFSLDLGHLPTDLGQSSCWRAGENISLSSLWPWII